MRTKQLSDEEFRAEIAHQLDEWHRRLERITRKANGIEGELKIVRLKADEIARRKSNPQADE
jgi:hypothetical protein